MAKSRNRQPLRVLIVDDEPLGKERVRTLLSHDERFEIVAEADNGIEAVHQIKKSKPDLVFLDIQMPDLDGFGVIETVGVNNMPNFIFVTAYDEFALRAFDVHAVDYLLKPFDSERFGVAVACAIERFEENSHRESNEKLIQLLNDVRKKSLPLDRLLVKSHKRMVLLKLEEIDYIEAAGNHLQIYVGSSTHLLRQTMTRLESELDPAHFLRIHRSTIVNLDRVKELHAMFNGEYQIVLQGGTRLTVSRGYRDQLNRFVL